MLLDFEKAVINANRNTFSNIDVNVYFFSFSLNLWKHIQQLGLQGCYLNDHKFLLATLSFVSLNYVIKAFYLLMDQFCSEYRDEEDQLMECYKELRNFEETTHAGNLYF